MTFFAGDQMSALDHSSDDQAVKTTTDSLPFEDARWRLTAVAAMIGVSSWLRPLSFDEAFWLVFARRMLSGELPYFDLLDNKGPLWYPLVALLDVLPGPFLLWRTAAVVGISVGIALAGRRIALDLGATLSAATALGSVGGISAAFFTGFSLSTEFLATLLIGTSLALIRRPIPATGLAIAGAAIDLRAVLFIPAVLLALSTMSGRRAMRIGLAMVVGAALAATVILVWSPDVRFALVDLSLSTRFAESLSAIRLVRFAFLAILPSLAIALILRSHRPALWQLVTIGTAIVVGASPLFPFGHYWTYVALVPPIIGARVARPHLATIAALAAVMALLPIGSIALAEANRDGDLVDRFAPVTSELAEMMGDDDRAVVWSEYAHVSLDIAPHLLGSAPNSNYIGWDTSRHSRFVAEMTSDLQIASVIVIQGTLDPRELRPGYRPAAAEISAALTSFECSFRVGEVTVYRRTGPCSVDPSDT